MKILLVSLNASFMHTNIAVRCLKNYAQEYFSKIGTNLEDKIQIEYAEFTINQPVGDVLRGIAARQASVVLFSTYIWNADYVCRILPDVKKILPDCILGAGGPEFGYSAKKYLLAFPSLDFVIFGEGEETFSELAIKLFENEGALDQNLGLLLKSVPGIFFRNPDNGDFDFSGNRKLIENLDSIPFPYPEIPEGNFEPDHKIYYYESSRGCPFSCAYCLSSVEKSVRFKSLGRVFAELQVFLDANVSLVKFVDRTYNLNPARYVEIWRYILNHHNGKTMFHFEIEAEFLSEEALDFLQKVPSGVMQFEMGVQSANKKTLLSINRSDNIEKLAMNIRRIPRTIHQHLDLIAGLPFENLESFGKSFDFVMDLRPDALQLGFLKVLHGTQMEQYAKKNGWAWMENPVYETFSTPYLSYEDVNFLKDIEVLTDELWNKGIFFYTMNYIFRFVSPWKFLCELTEAARKNNVLSQARKDSYWFDFLAGYFAPADKKGKSVLEELELSLVMDLLRYDFIRSGKKGGFPAWYARNYSKENHLALLSEKETSLSGRKIGFAMSDYEEFSFDVTSAEPEKQRKNFKLLLCYGQK